MIRLSCFPAILTAEEAARRCRAEAIRSGTVVFTNGVFDVLHRGHLDYLREARALGTLLIVGVNSDASVRRLKGPQRPLVTQDDRAFALAALRWVDHVVIFDEDTPHDLISALRPHVLVKGGDYAPEAVIGADVVTAGGGKVAIIPFREGYSTSGFLKTIAERFR